MKVLITEQIAEQGIEELRQEFDVEVALGLPLDELLAKVANADALIVRSATQVTAEIIEAGKNLKIIGRAGVGVDNVDVTAATKRGIIVCNAPTANVVSAAELAMALMLSLCRQIPAADASLRQHEWQRSKFSGVELYDKVLGILGAGRIGSLVAERAKAFGMKVVAFDPYISKERADMLGIELAATPEDLYKVADFITIHLPKTPETAGMISTAQLAMMKPGVRIINAARGGLVDEAALAEAIKSGHVGGAAFDVYVTEPCTDSPLFELQNTVCTPHLGASTEEAQDKAGLVIAEMVAAGLRGEFVTTAVNLPIKAADKAVQDFIGLAERIGRLFAGLAEGRIEQITVEVEGLIASHDTSLLTVAAMKGLLSNIVSVPVTYVNVLDLCKERGIEIKEVKGSTSKNYVNLLRISGTQGGELIASVAATKHEPDQERLVEVNGYEVDISPTEFMGYFRYEDRPGVIGRVGVVLGEAGINIASMQVGRRQFHGEAAMLISVDSEMAPDLIATISEQNHMTEAKFVRL